MTKLLMFLVAAVLWLGGVPVAGAASKVAANFKYSLSPSVATAEAKGYGSVQAVCSAWFDGFRQDQKEYYQGVVAGLNSCSTTNPGLYAGVYKVYYCAGGVEPDSDNMCTAPPPPPPDQCKADAPRVQKYFMNKNSAFPTCDGGCQITVEEVLVCRSEKFNGVPREVCMLQVRRVGGACGYIPPVSPQAPGDEDKSAPKIDMPQTKSSGEGPSGSCPKGSVQGGVDSGGIAICIGTGTSPQAPSTPPPTVTKPPITTNNPDGSSTTTQTVETTNKDGSVTSTTTVTSVGADGTKTVTVTGNTGKTSDGTDGSKDQEKPGFCKENPTLSICRESSVSGACEEVQCVGDAIQCSTLRAAAALECRDKNDRKDAKESAAGVLGEQLLAGNDPLKSSLPSAQNATVVNVPGTLDQSGWLGGGAYFQDKTFSMRGYTFTIPFSKTASALIAFRYAMMLVAALVSFKIVRSAILT